MKVESAIRWAAKWCDSESQYICHENLMPVLFLTRAAARKWINEKFGYIRERPELRAKPFCWKVPIAVKVIVKEI